VIGTGPFGLTRRNRSLVPGNDQKAGNIRFSLAAAHSRRWWSCISLELPFGLQNEAACGSRPNAHSNCTDCVNVSICRWLFDSVTDRDTTRRRHLAQQRLRLRNGMLLVYLRKERSVASAQVRCGGCGLHLPSQLDMSGYCRGRRMTIAVGLAVRSHRKRTRSERWRR
jgi:hypothetical protein